MKQDKQRNYKGLDFSSYESEDIISVLSVLRRFLKVKIDYVLMPTLDPYFYFSRYICDVCNRMTGVGCDKCIWGYINKAFFNRYRCSDLRNISITNLKAKKAVNARIRKIAKVLEAELTKRITPGGKE